MSKASKACDISPVVRREVTERDGGRCILCGAADGIQIAHYIPRSRLGLGTARNLACMCHICHQAMDNGNLRTPYEAAFKRYLREKYSDWNEDDLVYRKWR